MCDVYIIQNGTKIITKANKKNRSFNSAQQQLRLQFQYMAYGIKQKRRRKTKHPNVRWKIITNQKKTKLKQNNKENSFLLLSAHVLF